MARFTVQITLRNATDGDYERLHDLMQAQGFFRTIDVEDETEYPLPAVVYDIEGSVDINNVRDRAKGAAANTNRDFELLVTESSRSRWQHLRRDR